LIHGAAHGSIRFTLGQKTTEKDIDYVLKVLPEIIGKLRAISPINIDPKKIHECPKLT
ncbi:MAG: cysteine desulfurase NifS, partial [Patescibacteria group bacterium]